MNAVKIVFPDCTNLLCRFHIDKNVKAKCKSLVDCPSKDEFNEWLKKFEITCSPWPIILKNSLGDLCCVWEAMNNMIMLQHTEIKVFFETSTNVVGHVLKVIWIGNPYDMQISQSTTT
ncbi:hypothetical protein GmHk_04G010617 [Glycine max]|nr:hypothetical protein GmHk_04G010617 [Glycine max]